VSESFEPDYACPPGWTLEEFNFPMDVLTKRLQLTRTEVKRLLSGRHPIDEPLAAEIAALTDTSPLFWLRLEHKWRKHNDRTH